MTTRLVFDFDGVLLHSHIESMLTAYNVACNTLELIPDLLPEKFQTLFSHNRAAVRNAGEMVSLAIWCAEPDRSATERLSRKDLLALFPPAEVIHERTARFFKRRAELFEQHPEAWLRLNTPYQPLWDFVKDQGFELLIVTHKNKDAVLALTKHYGLEVAARNIFSGDGNKSKAENFSSLFESFPAAQYYFVDDNLRNLIELSSTVDAGRNLKLLYASWGYGSEQDTVEATAAGIIVHSQDSFIDLVGSLDLV